MSVLEGLKSLFKTSKRSTGAAGSGGAYISPRAGGSLALPSFGGDPMTVATVYRCVRLLSDSVAALPLIYSRLRGEVFVPDDATNINYLLTVQPNPTMSAADFWAKVVEDKLLAGNAYIIPIYGRGSAEIERFVLCRRGTVTHDYITDTYTVHDATNGITGTFSEDEVIHIKNYTIDGKRGISTLHHAQLVLNTAVTGDTETLNCFANGGNVRGIISNDKSTVGLGVYENTQLQQTAKKINEMLNTRDRIMWVPGQVDFKQFSLSSTDMQFLESRKFTVRDICRFFGVYPSFVFDDTSNNYKSAEMANVAFLSNTLNPLLHSIECEFNRKLIAPALWNKRRVQFDRRSLYACDLESRAKYQSQTIAAGIYTVNDWRRFENQPTVEGGDRVLVSANLKGINDVIAEATPQNKDKENNEA